MSQKATEARERAVRVAFVHETDSTFVVQDLEMLGSFASVVDSRFASPLDAFRMAAAIARSEIVYIWFSSGRAATLALALGKVLGKKVVSVAGGSEVSSEPTFRGLGRRSRLRFFFTRLILDTADCVLCVSDFTKREVLRCSRPRRCEVVHNAVDADRFRPSSKGQTILTVAAAKWRTKGIDRFIELASNLPNRRFLVVGGVAGEMPTGMAKPENVEFVGALAPPQLVPIFAEARFYCQLSRYESFGVALAESMLAGCVPIASDAGALPEVVGDGGFVVPEGDPRRVAEIIEGCWAQSDALGRRARRRIEAGYSLDSRRSRLESLL
ncbi:MAG TPA: glycosyltransferase, partial [Nitrososphaerales archaeon]|nr:glycosyltransferase [Nitrososphaerales archaeon]